MIKRFLRKYWDNIAIVLAVSLLWLMLPQGGVGVARPVKVVYIEEGRDYQVEDISAEDIQTLASKILEREPYKSWTFDDWDTNIRYRGIDHKSTDKLKGLLEPYFVKIYRAAKELKSLQWIEPSKASLGEVASELINLEAIRLQLEGDLAKAETEEERKEIREQLERLSSKIERYKEVSQVPEEIDSYTVEIARLVDKFISVAMELQFRQKGLVDREIHGTWYYIDLDNGNDGNDGLSVAGNWLTINQYTSVTVRTPGDVAWVRAGTSEIITADITADEDGKVDNLIEIRGCSSVDDPWGDGSDVKPIIDANNAAWQMYWNGDNYWRFYRLDIKQSTDTQGALKITYSRYAEVDSCDIHDNGTYGIYPSGSITRIVDSTFYSNGTANLYPCRAYTELDGCTLNGGPAGTNYGISTGYTSVVQMKDTTFGVTTGHNTADLYCSFAAGASILRGRNVTLGTSGKEVSISGYGAAIQIEGYGQLKDCHKSYYYQGTVTNSSTVLHPGGASSSALVEPNAYCGLNRPLTIGEDWLFGDFKVYCTAVATTVHVYIRDYGGWAVYPNATTLYVQAVYYNGTGSSRVESTASTSVLYDASTWVDFNTTFTPGSEGFAYVYVYLKRHEANKGIYVDIKPTAT